MVCASRGAEGGAAEEEAPPGKLLSARFTRRPDRQGRAGRLAGTSGFWLCEPAFRNSPILIIAIQDASARPSALVSLSSLPRHG